jgi:hypothetical protein
MTSVHCGGWTHTLQSPEQAPVHEAEQLPLHEPVHVPLQAASHEPMHVPWQVP